MLRVATDHFAHSDTGRQRRANEDSYFARSPVFVVADGMGGAQAGEIASGVAVEAFERGLDDEGASSPEELLAQRVQEANARIHEMSRADPERAGMGTTITAAHVGSEHIAVAHVGDSRAYRLRAGEFERLTQDHSLVAEMVRRGQITDEEAEEHPQRSIITRALGPEAEVRVDTYSWRGQAGDVYLLCSDGLTSMIPEAQVSELVRAGGSPQTTGQSLIDAANEAGGRDNITVILFRLEEVGDGDGRGRDLAETTVSDRPTVVGSGALKTAEVRVAVAGAPPPPPAAPASRSHTTFRLQPRAPAPSPAPPPSKRGRAARRLAKTLLVLAILVVPVGIGGYLASQAVYFVGTDEDGFVALYRGLPYELPAGVRLYRLNYVSGVPADAMRERRRARLLDHSLRSHDDAVDLLRQLERGRLAS